MEGGTDARAFLAKAAATFTVLSLLPVALSGSAPSHASVALRTISSSDFGAVPLGDVPWSTSLFASFTYEHGVAFGTYAQFGYNATTGTVRSLIGLEGRAPVLFLESIGIEGFPPARSAAARGPIFEAAGYLVTITAQDDPTALLEIRSDMPRFVRFVRGPRRGGPFVPRGRLVQRDRHDGLCAPGESGPPRVQVRAGRLHKQGGVEGRPRRDQCGPRRLGARPRRDRGWRLDAESRAVSDRRRDVAPRGPRGSSLRPGGHVAAGRRRDLARLRLQHDARCRSHAAHRAGERQPGESIERHVDPVLRPRFADQRCVVFSSSPPRHCHRTLSALPGGSVRRGRERSPARPESGVRSWLGGVSGCGPRNRLGRGGADAPTSGRVANWRMPTSPTAHIQISGSVSLGPCPQTKCAGSSVVGRKRSAPSPPQR